MSSTNAPQYASYVAVRTLLPVKNVRIDSRLRTLFADDASSAPDSKRSSPRSRSFDPPILKPHVALALGKTTLALARSLHEPTGLQKPLCPKITTIIAFSSALRLQRPLHVPHPERLVQQAKIQHPLRW
ncbi:hypothetical protein HPB51_001791 [Rhipicephalus microplus]|uniref:Uncharacterized protein n=1 Tax=Rhipicephalus microplus TaxID=6941 RepID=A0A9J6EWF0_RHIMP|nr:hypothetical protein HPB51_001791 [Rhipicephalus microplus]